MSSAPTQLVVAPTASNLVASTAQIQKDYLEEPIPRQNSLGNRVRGGLKGKHLTRSHAMRESASPPRTPTPRSDQLATSPVSTAHSSSETISDSNKMHVQSSSSSSASSSVETPSVIVTSQHSQQQQQQHSPNDYGVCNQSQLDLDFPKLTPPKSSKCPRNNRDQSQSSSSSSSEKQHINTSSNINEYNNKSAFNTNSPATSLIESITGSSNNYNKSGIKINESSGSIKSHNNSNNTNNNMGNHIHSSMNHNWNRQNSPPNEKMNMNSGCANNNNSNNTNSSSGGVQTIAISSKNSLSVNTNSSSLTTNHSTDKENRCPRIESQNSSNSGTFSLDGNQSESPTDGSKNDRLNKKHKSGANSKSSKPRLKNMGSSSSVEGGNSTSGFISRDSSTDQFTDQNGTDLVQFFKETLNKNPKDKSMLIKIEKDLLDLAHDNSRSEIKFPSMSSYNRMLIHRVAAFFGMEHNVDSSQTCVIVQTTNTMRIPDIRFKSLFCDEPRRSILKRDTHSFEDPRHNYLCPDRGLDRKSKSFEEREEEYEKARRRIFKRGDGHEVTEEHYWPWNNSENSDQSARMRQQKSHKLLKVHSLSSDGRHDGRPSVSKSHSFGGYGGPPSSGGPLARGDSINSTKSAGPRLFPKQDSVGSTNTPWRLSPSSSGYKTQTQSLRSDSVTPSPTGCGSDDHTPEPSVVHSPPSAASCGVVWAVTDMASVPRGSILINPQTLQPIVNQDGSIYHFDPSNLPPSQAVPPAMYNSTKSIGINTTVHRKKNDKPRRSGGNDVRETHNNNSGNNNEDGSSGGNDDGNSDTNLGNKPLTNNTQLSENEGGSGGGDGGGNGGGSQGIESSIETLSESSAQTVIINTYSRDDIENNAQEITKENHCHRDMSDIQEELHNNSLDENDKATATNCEHLNDIQHKPKVKNQATSPNIPSPEPDEATQLNEVSTTNTNSNETTPITVQQATNIKSISNSTSSSPQIISSGQTKHSSNNYNNNGNNSSSYKKEESKTISTNASMVTYTNNYQSIDGSTLYPAAGNGPYPATTTTYQQGPDGSVYAVPQPMIYAYPPTMDGEIQGYFMPVFDQSGQRDANNTLLSAPAQTLYQPAGTATTVVPVAYPTTPYGSAPIYQNQVVYSPADHFASTPTTGQMHQCPITYPVGYPYPYSGYWGQAMTYYVPPPIPGNAMSSSVMPPPIPANPAGNQNTVGSSTNGGNNGKRTSPHQQNLSNGQSSQSATPAGPYQFAPGVPLALASDPNGPTMYAIPQPAVFPNVIPYGPPNTPSAPTGVLASLPHQPNAVISSLISHPSGPTGSHVPVEQPLACGTYTISSANGNHGTGGGTPQSTPSTPLSTNVSSVALPPQARNPPLFATPPMIPNGFNPQIYNQYTIDSHNTGATHEKKNSSNGGNSGKKNNNSNYTSNTRQNSSHSYSQSQNRKPNMNSNTNSNSNENPNINLSSNNHNTTAVNRQIHNSSQQKRINEKTHQQISTGLINVSNMGNTQNNSDKPRTGGIRSKPGNLDLRRNTSQRNTPSTNSIESNNNSPNSIASNTVNGNSGNNAMANEHVTVQMYMPRGTHIPPIHSSTGATVLASAAAATNDPAACHQQLIGAAYNPHPPTGMYFKYGQTYFTHPSMALPNNRRSPPNELRPSITPLTSVYPVNMMLPAPRQMQPRHPNPNYKGNKPR